MWLSRIRIGDFGYDLDPIVHSEEHCFVIHAIGILFDFTHTSAPTASAATRASPLTLKRTCRCVISTASSTTNRPRVKLKRSSLYIKSKLWVLLNFEDLYLPGRALVECCEVFSGISVDIFLMYDTFDRQLCLHILCHLSYDRSSFAFLRYHCVFEKDVAACVQYRFEGWLKHSARIRVTVACKLTCCYKW